MNTLRQIHSDERSPRPYGCAAGHASLGHSPHAANLRRRSLELKERMFGPNHKELGLALFAEGRIDHEVL